MNCIGSKVSIVTPVLNRVDLIKVAAQSVLSQSYDNWEWVVVDDGSSDGTLTYLRLLEGRDKRVRVFSRRSLANGPSSCRNIGTAMASGDFVMYLDSDDILLPRCLENRVLRACGNSEFDFFIFPVKVRYVDSGRQLYWNIDRSEDDLSRFLRLDGVWHTSSGFYKRDFIANHLFDTDLPFFEDWEFAIRAILSRRPYLKLLMLDPDTVITRHNERSISQKGFKFANQLEIQHRIFQKVKDLLRLNRMWDSGTSQLLYSNYIVLIREAIRRRRFSDLSDIHFFLSREYGVSRFSFALLAVYFALEVLARKVPICRLIYQVLGRVRLPHFSYDLVHPHRGILKYPYPIDADSK